MADVGRIVVSVAELRDLWFSDDAVALQYDSQAHARVVRMADGTEYIAYGVDVRSESGSGR